MEKENERIINKKINNIILCSIHCRNEINEIPDEELLQLISFVDNSSSGMTRTHKKQNGNVTPELDFLTNKVSLEIVHLVSYIDKNYSLWRKRIKKKEIRKK